MSDFLVIGGGIAGVSAAARLAPLGSVTLLEAEDALGYHASGRSAAMFEQNYGSPSTVALNRASRAYLEDQDVLTPRGLLMVALEEEKDEAARTIAELGLEPMPIAEAVRRVPILDASRVVLTAWHEDALDIDTDRLLQGYVRTARQAGAQIVTGARVTAIRRGARGGWAAETEKGAAYEGRMIVNAAGAWADRIAALAGVPGLGLVPCRRSMARIPAPGGHDVSGWPMLFGPGESWYAKPDAGKLLVSPADETPVEPHDAWADDMDLAHGIARYEAHVTEPVTRVEHSWAGLRSFTPDRSLAIGFAPQDRSFFWVAGQGGYGMQSSAAASQLAADLIAGRTPQIDAAAVAALDPARFAA